MPELPEVETVVNTLKKLVLNQKIKNINVYWDNIISQNKEYFINNLLEKVIIDIKRRGKFIIFVLNKGYLVSHLRMEGKYYFYDKESLKDKHTHLIFDFENHKQLHYNDTRKFGKFEYLDYFNYDNFKNLGIEPFDERFDLDYVKKIISKSNKEIKPLLLNQQFIAGIGNIYVDEILFMSKIHPETIAKKLDENDMLNIIKYTKKILSSAIESGGTTIKSYTSSLGISGRFQLFLKVCQRKDEKCYECNEKITKIFLKGRGTYYCQKCQPKK